MHHRGFGKAEEGLTCHSMLNVISTPYCFWQYWYYHIWFLWLTNQVSIFYLVIFSVEESMHLRSIPFLKGKPWLLLYATSAEKSIWNTFITAPCHWLCLKNHIPWELQISPAPWYYSSTWQGTIGCTFGEFNIRTFNPTSFLCASHVVQKRWDHWPKLPQTLHSPTNTVKKYTTGVTQVTKKYFTKSALPFFYLAIFLYTHKQNVFHQGRRQGMEP